MFGSKKSITDRVKDSLTDYLDDKFEDYRGQIALDLARGLGSLAGLVALWSVAVIAVIFISIALALLLGWAFSFFIQSFAYVLSFLIVAVALIIAARYIVKHREQYIVTPVFEIMAKTLRSNFGLDEEQEETPTHTEHNPHTKEGLTLPPLNDKTSAPLNKEGEPLSEEVPPVKTETPPPSPDKD